MCVKTGMFVYPNTSEEGLRIYHLGNILISKSARVGKRFTVRPGCVIGDVADAKRAAIVEDDVEFSLGVKVFGAIKIGRGSIINGNALVIKNIPPYAMVVGNPAKIIGLRYDMDTIIEMEKNRYSENERISMDVLEKNAAKYVYPNRKGIMTFLDVRIRE